MTDYIPKLIEPEPFPLPEGNAPIQIEQLQRLVLTLERRLLEAEATIDRIQQRMLGEGDSE